MTGRENIISIAIETSCRQGGVALGVGDTIVGIRELGTTGRHAADLLPQLDDMLTANGYTPRDLNEVYVSVGPGSFTGLRVGITVARILGEAVPGLKVAAVPTALAVATNYLDGDWQHMGVLLAAKDETIHATLVSRDELGRTVLDRPDTLATIPELLAKWPRPLLLAGEGLGFVTAPELSDVHLADKARWYPQVESVWAVGNHLAHEGEFTEYHQLLPTYARAPEAVRLWEKRHGIGK